MNMLGIGIDIEQVDRFRDSAYATSDTLLRRMFTSGEIVYCRSHDDPAPHMAGRFAAKEAVIKALSSAGVRAKDLLLTDIEIGQDASGAPTVSIPASIASNAVIRLSMSHSGDTAVACAILFSL